MELTTEYEPVERAQWQRKVAEVLRKMHVTQEELDSVAAPELLLTTELGDGFNVQPLYTADDSYSDSGFPGFSPYTRGARVSGASRIGWNICGWYSGVSPRITNEHIRTDLEGGVNSIWLDVASHDFGKDGIAEAMHGVYLDAVSLALTPNAHYEIATQTLINLFTEQKISAEQVSVSLGIDPVGLRALTGQPHDIALAADIAVRFATIYPKSRAFVADGLPFHNAGGSDVQELGIAIASAVAYLRSMTDTGFSVSAAASQIDFRFAATTDQFTTIAKFRAARKLWDRVLSVSGVDSANRAMRQHAVTSPAMMTKFDRWTNIMRTTVACFAAGVGGADTVTVLPFDYAVGKSDQLSRRIARNTHAILLEESMAGKVIDPAGGSWYVENLTDAVAQQAWEFFRDIERQGGIESALNSGFLTDKISESSAGRLRRIACGKQKIIGVTNFVNLEEKLLSQDFSTHDDHSDQFLPLTRYAQPFEQIRAVSEKYTEKLGSRPRIFLAHSAQTISREREDFILNFLQAGGLDIVRSTPESVDELILKFDAADVSIVVLSGYELATQSEIAALANGLRQVGARGIFTYSTHPGKENGIDGTIDPDHDSISVLRSIVDLAVGA